MQVMKKLSALLLAAALAVSAAGCGETSASSATAILDAASSAVSGAAVSGAADSTPLRVVALKGPTGLGMVKLMKDADGNALPYKFTLETAPDAAVAKLTSGEADVAALPTNLAAVLYKKTSGKVQMAAVNTLGILSVVTNGEKITSIKDLKGKTVCSSGQGAVPEYAFNYILKQNGLTPGKDVQVEYAAEHAEVVARLLSGKAKIAVLPEPFVTQALTKCKTATRALDLTKEWNSAVTDGSVLSMGCLVVRKPFAQQHKAALDHFLAAYKVSTEYTNANAADAGKLAQKYLGMPAAVAAKAIPNCSITYLDGSEMKEKIQPFLKVLYQQNPKSVGGKLPDEGLYYQK